MQCSAITVVSNYDGLIQVYEHRCSILKVVKKIIATICDDARVFMKS